MSDENAEQILTALPTKLVSQGVSTALVAALDPSFWVCGISFQCFASLINKPRLFGDVHGRLSAPSVQDFVKDPSTAEKLWSLSEVLTTGERTA